MNHSSVLRNRKFVKLERYAHPPSLFISVTSHAGMALLLTGIAASIMETAGFLLSGTWTTLTLQQVFVISFHNEPAALRHIVHHLITQPLDMTGCLAGAACMVLAVLMNWLFER